MNILVVEDNKEQREDLIKIIEREFIDIRVYSTASIRESLSITSSKDIKLFLIDINLEDGSGIDLAKEIRNMNQHILTPIVFITTEMIHIIDAFKNIHCYDFIIKPYNTGEIKQMINIFYDKFSNKSLKEGKSTFFKIDGELSIKVYHKDIIFIEYVSRKCILHTTQGKYNIKGIGLGQMLQELNDAEMIQSHKAYAVNLKYIDKIEKIYSKLWDIKFINYDETAQLGYKYKDYFLDRVK